MLSKTEFLGILDKILTNENLLEKTFLKNIKENEIPEEVFADFLIEKLRLETIKGVTDEDGYFNEFVRTENQTEIFYLLKRSQVSCLHSLDTTETWRWLGGKKISIFIFTNEVKEITLSETNPSYTIDKGTLFGAKITDLTDNNDFGLVTCLCEPAFEIVHYINPTSEQIYNLYNDYPEKKALIDELKPKISTKKKNIMQSIIQFFTCCIGVKKNEEQKPLINNHLPGNR